MTICISNPDQISFARLCALRGALRLEIQGLKRSRGPTAYSILKKEFGYAGTRPQVLEAVTNDINSKQKENAHV